MYVKKKTLLTLFTISNWFLLFESYWLFSLINKPFNKIKVIDLKNSLLKIKFQLVKLKKTVYKKSFYLTV